MPTTIRLVRSASASGRIHQSSRRRTSQPITNGQPMKPLPIIGTARPTRARIDGSTEYPPSWMAFIRPVWRSKRQRQAERRPGLARGRADRSASPMSLDQGSGSRPQPEVAPSEVAAGQVCRVDVYLAMTPSRVHLAGGQILDAPSDPERPRRHRACGHHDGRRDREARLDLVRRSGRPGRHGDADDGLQLRGCIAGRSTRAGIHVRRALRSTPLELHLLGRAFREGSRRHALGLTDMGPRDRRRKACIQGSGCPTRQLCHRCARSECFAGLLAGSHADGRGEASSDGRAISDDCQPRLARSRGGSCWWSTGAQPAISLA